MHILRATNTHADFTRLVARLDAELRRRYGAGQDAYDRHNVIDPIDTAVLAYIDGAAVACGCFKIIDGSTVEMKRMYVDDGYRRRGLGRAVVAALEAWAAELGHARAILETGKGQPEAVSLYRAMGYAVTDNYGPYVGLENSVCMAKTLSGPCSRA
jgi:GNAT superfamily N-acetyltransferase